MHSSLASLLFVTLVCGCTATGSARYNAEVTTPNLVYVSDDVQVIEDYDQPVFFSANMYWRYDNGVWFQSRQHTRGWVRVSTPPAPILRIERPAAYVHFRGSARANAVHHDGPPARDERREMKEERKEAKQEAKEERQEAKQEAKQERKEAKEERKEAKEERKEDRKDAKEDRKNKK